MTITSPESTQPSAPISAPSSMRKIAWKIFRETAAIAFWLYSMTSIFLFDVDALLLQELPSWAIVLVHYKPLVFLVTIAITWVFLKTKSLLLFLLFIAAYPFVLVGRLLLLLAAISIKLRSWVVAMAAIQLILSFVQNFRTNFFMLVGMLVFSTIALTSQSRSVLYVSVVVLAFIITILIARRYWALFRPTPLYVRHTRAMAWLLRQGRTLALPAPEIRGKPPDELTAEQSAKWVSNLETAIVLNRSCYFLSAKLGEYIKSPLSFLFYISGFAVVAVVAMMLVGVVDYALFEIDPHSFSYHSVPNAFDFVYQAVLRMTWRETPMVPLSVYARVADIFTVFVSYALLGALAVLVIPIRRNREQHDIDMATRDFQAQATEMSSFISMEFKMTTEEAIAYLKHVSAGLMSVIDFLESVYRQEHRQ